MRMQRHGVMATSGSAHAIDLAPMLDFVLNLLIFFIITAIFIKEVVVDVDRPAITQTENPTSGINIRILDSGEIFLDNRLVDVRAIRANVESKKAGNAALSVTVLADKEATTGTIVGVVNQVRLGGVENITFTTGQ